MSPRHRHPPRGAGEPDCRQAVANQGSFLQWALPKQMLMDEPPALALLEA